MSKKKTSTEEVHPPPTITRARSRSEPRSDAEESSSSSSSSSIISLNTEDRQLLRSSMLPSQHSNNNNNNNNNSNINDNSIITGNNNNNIITTNSNLTNNEVMNMMQQMQIMILQSQQQIVKLSQQIAEKNNSINDISLHSKKHSKKELDEDDRIRLKDESKDRFNLIVFDEEEDDGYVPWLIKRQRLFPLEQYKTKYYKTRYTLLSRYDRKFEYYRSLFQFKGHKDLFPSLWIRYYHYALYKAGVPGYEKVRRVDPRVLSLPGWYVDKDDTQNDVKLDTQNDMPPYSKTFQELPEDLQKDPIPTESAPIHHNTLEEYTNEFISQMKLYQISRRKVGDEASSSAYVGRINQNREDYNEDSDSD